MIRRKIRVELSEFDSDWKDSFILLYTGGVQDQLDTGKKLRKNAREEKKLTDLKESSKDEKYIEEQDKKLDELAKEIFNIFYDAVSEHFLGGMIYDYDLKTTRELKKEDIVLFDTQIYKVLDYNQYIGAGIIGFGVYGRLDCRQWNEVHKSFGVITEKTIFSKQPIIRVKQ